MIFKIRGIFLAFFFSCTLISQSLLFEEQASSSFNEEPYLSLLTKFNAALPEGTLIDSSWILTAASREIVEGSMISIDNQDYQVVRKVPSPYWEKFTESHHEWKSQPKDYPLQWGDFELLQLSRPVILIAPAKRARWVSAPKTGLPVMIVSYNKNEKVIGENPIHFSNTFWMLEMDFMPQTKKSGMIYEVMMDPNDKGAGIYVKSSIQDEYLLLGVLSRVNPKYNPQKNLYQNASFIGESLIGPVNTWIDNTIIAAALKAVTISPSQSVPIPPPSLSIPPITLPPPPPPPSIATISKIEKEALDLGNATGLNATLIDSSWAIGPFVNEKTAKKITQISVSGKTVGVDKDVPFDASFTLFHLKNPITDVQPVPRYRGNFLNLNSRKFYVPEKIKTAELKIGGVQNYFAFTLNNVTSQKIDASTLVSDSGAGVFIQDPSLMLTGLLKDKKIFLLNSEINTFIDNTIIAQALFVSEAEKKAAANKIFAQKHYGYFDGTVGDFIEKNKALSLFKNKININDLKKKGKYFTVFAPVNYGMADLNPTLGINTKYHIYEKLYMLSAAQQPITLLSQPTAKKDETSAAVTFSVEESALEVQSLLTSRVVGKAVICNNGIVYGLDLPIILTASKDELITQDTAGLPEVDKAKIKEVTGHKTVLKALDEKAKDTNWSLFPKLIKQAGFSQTLNRAIPFTLFALGDDVISWVATELGYASDLSDMGLEDLKYLLMHFVIFNSKLSPRSDVSNSGYINSKTGKPVTVTPSAEYFSWSEDKIFLILDGFVFNSKDANNAYDPRGKGFFDKVPINGSIIYVDNRKVNKVDVKQSELFITPILSKFPKKSELIEVLDFSKVPEGNLALQSLVNVMNEVIKEEKKPEVVTGSLTNTWTTNIDKFKQNETSSDEEDLNDW